MKSAQSVDRLALKSRVDSVGRLHVAQKIGIGYTALSNKLLGYCNFVGDEVERIEAAIRELSPLRKALHSALKQAEDLQSPESDIDEATRKVGA